MSPLDPMMDATAQKMAAGRAARPMPMMQRGAPAPPPPGLAEVRSLLQQAMELLDNMGGGEVV